MIRWCWREDCKALIHSGEMSSILNSEDSNVATFPMDLFYADVNVYVRRFEAHNFACTSPQGSMENKL